MLFVSIMAMLNCNANETLQIDLSRMGTNWKAIIFDNFKDVESHRLDRTFVDRNSQSLIILIDQPSNKKIR